MKNQQKPGKPTLTNRVKAIYRTYAASVLTGALLIGFGMTAYATTPAPVTDPTAVINNLSDFIFGLIRAIGMIMIGFGVVQVGLSLKSHDPSQRANGFLTLCGGIVIAFTKEILAVITGG